MGLSRQLTAVGLTINLTEINLVISDNPYTSAINLKPSSRAYAVLSYCWLSETALSTASPAGCTALSTNNTRLSGVSVAGPTVWNSLLDELRDETENTFRQSLKTLLLTQY